MLNCVVYPHIRLYIYLFSGLPCFFVTFLLILTNCYSTAIGKQIHYTCSAWSAHIINTHVVCMEKDILLPVPALLSNVLMWTRYMEGENIIFLKISIYVQTSPLLIKKKNTNLSHLIITNICRKSFLATSADCSQFSCSLSE